MANKVPLKRVELEFRQALLGAFFNLVPIQSGEPSTIEILGMSDNDRPRHNYQVQQRQYVGHNAIMYKGVKIGELWKKPHKVIRIYERYDNKRLYSKLLERVARLYIPEARVEIVYGE